MKATKKILSILLTLALLVVMAVPAFAAGNGKITINNAVSGNTYTIFKILDLESFDAENNKYAYKASEKWKDFVVMDGIKNVYLITDDAGYVTWAENANAEEFAELAKEYEKEKEIIDDGNIVADSSTVVFDKLDLGYYLLDTSLGSLCALDTTNPTVEMYEKNQKPGIEKSVYNKVDEKYTTANSARIGENVEFQTIVTAQKGAHGYIVHDAMSEGLTFNKDVKVYVGDKELGTDKYSVVTENLTQDGHPYQKCTFHVVFNDEYLETIENTTEIRITYSAKLNENAVIYEDSNYNNAKLEYGDNISTDWKGTDTYTFHIDVVKTDKDGIILSEAVFELYDVEEGGNPIKLVAQGEIDGKNTYRVAKENETANVVTEFNAEIASIIGLGRGTYYLQEVSAPEGYNKLTGRQIVELEKTNLHVVLDTHGHYYSGGVQVINQSGTELPSTGGIGTTLFYGVGGAMFLGALIMLVTKKRMKD